MKLIYRAQTLNYTPATTTYHKPNALNWRYQIPGETYENQPKIGLSSSKSHAINWRYQLA